MQFNVGKLWVNNVVSYTLSLCKIFVLKIRWCKKNWTNVMSEMTGIIQLGLQLKVEGHNSQTIEFTTYMLTCALVYILSHDDKWRLHSVEYFLQCGFHGANFLYRRTQGFIASCRFSRRRWDEKVLLSSALKFKHRKNCECCPGQSLSLSH